MLGFAILALGPADQIVGGAAGEVFDGLEHRGLRGRGELRDEHRRPEVGDPAGAGEDGAGDRFGAGLQNQLDRLAHRAPQREGSPRTDPVRRIARVDRDRQHRAHAQYVQRVRRRR